MKKSLRTSKPGDIYYFLISGKKYSKYKGKYIVLIRNSFDELWNMPFKTFYCKIVDAIDMESITKAPYVVSGHTIIERELGDKAPNYDMPTKDEYGFIYMYTLEVEMTRKMDQYDMQYLGNFPLLHPENEFVSIHGSRGETFCFYYQIEEEVIQNYEQYNLKKSERYTKEGNNRALQLLQYDVLVRKWMEEEEKSWNGDTKGWLLSMGIDIDQEIKEGKHLKDSLTYVGPEEEKNIKKKKS